MKAKAKRPRLGSVGLDETPDPLPGKTATKVHVFHVGSYRYVVGSGIPSRDSGSHLTLFLYARDNVNLGATSAKIEFRAPGESMPHPRYNEEARQITFSAHLASHAAIDGMLRSHVPTSVQMRFYKDSTWADIHCDVIEKAVAAG
jgi:hypothetical protein